MSDPRISRSPGGPQGIPPNRPEPAAGPAPQAPLGQPTAQQPGQFGRPVPPRPMHAPTAGLRTPRPDRLRQLRDFFTRPQPTASATQQPNGSPGHAAGQAPATFSQPYPNGGPGTAQPYAQPYQATMQPHKGLRYLKSALIGGGVATVLPSLQLLGALASTGGGAAGSTLLGYAIPALIRTFVVGAGIGMGVSAMRQRRRAQQEQQQRAWQAAGYPTGHPGAPMDPRQQGSMPPGGYAAPPQQAGWYPPAHPGIVGAPPA